MTYEEFKNFIVEQVQDRIPEIDTIIVREVVKNNGTVLDGMNLRKKGVNIAQTIYLNDFYKDFINGTSTETIVEQIVAGYFKNRKAEDIDIDFFTDFNRVKDKIIFKLVNRELNEGMLKDVPYIDYLDMVVIFCYYMENVGDGASGTIMIQNQHAKLWDVTADKLMSLAYENTARILGHDVMDLSEMVEKMTGMQVPEGTDPIFVLSNKNKQNGAGVILYGELLAKMAERMQDDLYVIPSSIHEVIIIPARADYIARAEELKELISFVNRNELSAGEILSDNLYYFSREARLLEIS